MLSFSIISIIINLIFGVWAYRLAQSQGRNPWVWFALGAFFGFWGLIILLFLPEPPLQKLPINSSKKSSLSLEESLFFDSKENCNQLWYFLNENHQSEGAFSFQKIRELYENKTIHSLTYVWNTTFSGWQRLKDVMKKTTS